MKKLLIDGVLVASAQLSHATPGFYNAGVPKADNAIESHFSLVGNSQSYVATAGGGFPVGPWIGDNTTSA